MLQIVQNYCPAGNISSLYCVWTIGDDNQNSPLIALWIDPSMRAFEAEFTLAAESDCGEQSASEPGSPAQASATPRVEISKELESFQP